MFIKLPITEKDKDNDRIYARRKVLLQKRNTRSSFLITKIEEPRGSNKRKRKIDITSQQNSSLQDKMIVRIVQAEDYKNDYQQRFQNQIERMKTKNSRYEIVIYNQCLQINGQMSYTDFQNIELTILRKQLIQSQLISEEQLRRQSYSNLTNDQSMEIEKIPNQIKKKKSQNWKFEITIQLKEQKRQIQDIYKKNYKNKNQSNADTVNQYFIYQERALLKEKLMKKSEKEHGPRLTNYGLHQQETI